MGTISYTFIILKHIWIVFTISKDIDNESAVVFFGFCLGGGGGGGGGQSVLWGP